MFNLPLVGFDTETTGVDVFDDDVRVVTCALIYSENSESPYKTVEYMMDPGVEIPEGASDVHGITTEVARAQGMEYTVGMQKVADYLTYTIEQGIPLTAYNGSFDATLLRVEFLRAGINFDDSLWNKMILIDPMVMDKYLDPWRRGGQKLGTVSKLYGYDLENAHNATADVEATIHIARRIFSKFVPKIESSLGVKINSYDELMDVQAGCYLVQKTSLEEYFRGKGGKGPDFTINKTWPFQTPGVD